MLNDIAMTALTMAGLYLLWRRWPQRAVQECPAQGPATSPMVSIIVPARNESVALPRLLASFNALSYANYEVIVVDDQSDDDTFAIARAHGGLRVRVVQGTNRPDGWRGKQWACQQGAAAAAGGILLFTDADTVHAPDSLGLSVDKLRAGGYGLLTTLPYHANRLWWERLVGPFHVLMLTVTAPYSKRPTPRRVFAIGQYLMFSRSTYDAIGGHAQVKSDIVEDLPLAKACLERGHEIAVFSPARPIFSVQMYASLAEFIAGWRRNFRAGLSMGPRMAPLEVTAMLMAMFGAATAGGLWQSVLTMLVAAGLVARAQRRLGRFSIWGVVLFPFAAVLFCLITAMTVVDAVTGQPVRWKGRAYPPHNQQKN